MRPFKTMWFEELESTNEYLKTIVNKVPETCEGTVIAAKKQSKGKGRKGRNWYTAPEKNLTFSLLVKSKTPSSQLSTITLVAGIAVAKTLNELGMEAKVKWPNDIMLAGKKICGILCELVNINNNKEASIIIGIGINVNMTQEEAQKIDKPATSIYIETGKSLEIEFCLEKLLINLDFWLKKWKSEGFCAIKEKWNQNCYQINKKIQITKIDGKIVTGTFLGVGDTGELIIKQENGEVLQCLEGDIQY